MNITHSVDGYIVRSLIRYCNYDKDKVNFVKSLIEKELEQRQLSTYKDKSDSTIYNTISKLNLLDITIINDINPSDIHKYHTDILKLTLKDLNLMLLTEPFEILPVHDCFGCHPNHMNVLRFWYNEILARLSNSTILESILIQLYGKDIKLNVFPQDISDLIREADYPIN